MRRSGLRWVTLRNVTAGHFSAPTTSAVTSFSFSVTRARERMTSVLALMGELGQSIGLSCKVSVGSATIHLLTLRLLLTRIRQLLALRVSTGTNLRAAALTSRAPAF